MKKKVPRRRNGIYYLNNKEYDSVTKILGVIEKPALYYWFKQQAARIALADPTLDEKEVIAKVGEISKVAAARGTTVHGYCEAKSKGEGYTVAKEYKGYTDALDSWWGTNEPKVLKNEVELYSDKYGYAGRCDAIVDINGEDWVLDYKTGKSIYKEVGLQLSAYRHALIEMGVVQDVKMGVLLLMVTGEYQFKETNDSIENFVNVMKVWRWSRGRE